MKIYNGYNRLNENYSLLSDKYELMRFLEKYLIMVGMLLWLV